MTGDDSTGRGPAAGADDAATRTRELETGTRDRTGVGVDCGAVGRLPFGRRDAPWLGIGLAGGALVVVVYLATNPYPAYGGGLYLDIAAEILAGGYALPATIPGYTADGVPFAYPPLQFYLLAVLLDVGADPIAVARILPPIGMLAGLVPVYLLARDYAGSRPAGGIASVAVAVNPQLVEWHVSAGGMVRAFAFLYAMTAIYAGYHAVDDGSRRSVVVGVVAFAATLLTHPTYALFVVVTYLVLWAVRDRSAPGFARGAVVGVGGVAIALPWLSATVATHGADVFVGAAGTHGGLGGGLASVAASPLTLAALVPAGYLLVARRDWFVAVWTAAATFLFSQPRFAYAVGSVALAAAALDAARRSGVPARLRERDRRTDGDGEGSRTWGRPLARVRGSRAVDPAAALAAFCLVAVAAGGGAYLAHEMTLPTDPSTPAFLDGEAVDAMAWAAAETPPDATFVVLGDAAEWFPALSGRTILIGPWGVEWKGADRYGTQLAAFESVSTCSSVDCVESTAATVGDLPDYVYVPKGGYTVRGTVRASFGTLERSFEHAPDWERTYENDGVVVYRRSSDGGTA